MRILIFEYVCGGGFRGARAPAGLRRDGRAMLAAALRDALRVPRATVYTLVEERHAQALPNGVSATLAGDDWRAVWRRMLGAADAALVVAPEEGDALLSLCEEARAARVLSLNCAPDAIRLAGDKLAFADTLRRCAVPAVPTRLYRPGEAPPEGCVLKPRDGAGCERTFRIRAEHPPGPLDADRQWVVQPWLAGQAVSLSLLAFGDRIEVLSRNRIDCSEHRGRLRVDAVAAGACDADAALRDASAALAEQLALGVPGLRGYIGVDAVWDGATLTVLECNPRLTTAYAGLSERRGEPQLFARMLDACR